MFSYRVSQGRYDPIKEAWRIVKRAGAEDRVVVSFTSDPYPPEEAFYRRTRKVLEVLSRGEATILVLTKNPTLALKDTDVFLRREGIWLGTTIARPPICRDAGSVKVTKEGLLTCVNDVWRELEPNAPSVSERINALKKAHELGIMTWVSIEPLIPMYDIATGDEIDWVSRFVFTHAKIVDWVVLGSLNYSPAMQEVSRIIKHEVNADTLRRYYSLIIPNIIYMLEKNKIPYYLKKELIKYVPNIKYVNTVPIGGEVRVVH